MQTLYEQESLATSLPPVNQVETKEQMQAENQTQTEELAPAATAARKRLVSKGRYAANIGKKAAFSSVGTAVVLFGVLSLIVAFVSLLALTQSPAADLVASLWTLLALFGGGGAVMLYLGSRALRDVRQMEVGVPLTRANTGSLPANDSLVRASQEPAQVQGTALLRAATQTQEQHEEQLLRPTTAQ